MARTKSEQKLYERCAERRQDVEDLANRLMKFGILIYDSDGNLRELHLVLNDLAEVLEKVVKFYNEVENGD